MVNLHCAGCRAAIWGSAGNESLETFARSRGWERFAGRWHCAGCRPDRFPVGALESGDPDPGDCCEVR